MANVTEEQRGDAVPAAARGAGGRGHPDPAQGDLDPKVQAAVILAESEERTVHADPDDAQGGHRQSADTADLP